MCFHLEYDSDETNDGNVLYQYPIHEAVFEGDCEKILSLLAEGHNVNFLNDSAETPVHVAVFNKQYSALKLLLSHDAQPVYEGVYCNPLVYATSEVDEECVQVIVTLLFKIYNVVSGLMQLIELLIPQKMNYQQVKSCVCHSSTLVTI